jgi:hypothetical protein
MNFFREWLKFEWRLLCKLSNFLTKGRPFKAKTIRFVIRATSWNTYQIHSKANLQLIYHTISHALEH